MLAIFYAVHAVHFFTVWRSLKPEWAFSTLRASTVQIGLMFTAATCAQTACTYLLNRFSARINRWLCVCLCQFLSVVGFVALPFCGVTMWLTVLPDSLILIGFAMSLESVSVLVARAAESKMSGPYVYVMMYTIYAAALNLGGSTGGLYAGPLGDQVGFNVTSWLTGGVSFTFSALLVIYITRGRFKCWKERPLVD